MIWAKVLHRSSIFKEFSYGLTHTRKGYDMKTTISVKVSPITTELHTRLSEISEVVQQCTNYVWQLWLLDAHAREADVKIHEWRLEYIQWCRDGQVGKAPSSNIPFISQGFQSRASSAINKRYPFVNYRCRTLLLNETVKIIKSKPAANGAYKLWQSALLNKENVPSALDPLPVPFDKANGKIALVMVEQPDGQPPKEQLVLNVRLDCYEKAGRSSKASDIISLPLVTNNSSKGYLKALFDIARADGRGFCGSEIVFNSRKKKWRANITIDIPDVPAVAAGKTLFIRPGRKRRCLSTRIPGDRSIWLRVSPDHVSHRRKRIAMAKEVRHEVVGSSRRSGHGRKKRLEAKSRLSGAWGRFTDTLSRQLSHAIIAQARKRGVSKVVWFRGKGKFALDMAGGEYSQSLPWPWYKTESALKRSCEKVGIEFVSRVDMASGEGRKGRRALKRRKKKMAAAAVAEVAVD